MSKKEQETPSETGIVQPIIDELTAVSPPELPKNDEKAPPRGPIHPPQPREQE